MDLYFKTIKNIEKIKGQVFNIGGGTKNSLCLTELFDILEKKLEVKLNYKKLPWRISDQKIFVADIFKSKEKISWKPKISKLNGIEKMIEWIIKLD